MNASFSTFYSFIYDFSVYLTIINVMKQETNQVNIYLHNSEKNDSRK